MAIKVALRDPKTSETRLVKIGWSWTLFFFSCFLGIPLFMRKLTSWGLLFVAMNVAFIVCQANSEAPSSAVLVIAISILQIVLPIYLGLKGNEITAKSYLARGWEFSDPTSDLTKYAKLQWRIFDVPSGVISPSTPNAGAQP